MRVWDLETQVLCRKHLLGEHRELHGLWNILTKHGGVGGYSHHPETKRWVGKLGALYNRHQNLVDEMQKRGYRHLSQLDSKFVSGHKTQRDFINTPDEQIKILKEKNCDCPLDD